MRQTLFLRHEATPLRYLLFLYLPAAALVGYAIEHAIRGDWSYKASIRWLSSILVAGSLWYLITELISLGLNGIEVYYPNHTHSQTVAFTYLAQKHHLLVTGGTDFHGEITPDIRLGVGQGNFSVPYSVYESLLSSINQR